MRHLAYILYILVATLMSVGCSSDTTIEEERPITPIGKDPIAFTGAEEYTVARSAAATRAEMLQTGFVVSTYKKYGTNAWAATEHTVMDRYSVNYKETRDDWNGVVISNWNYIDIINLWSGNRQEEKFWDYSGFPYRFHAIAPANGNTINNSQIETLSQDALSIKASYKAQKFTAPASDDETLLPAANTITTPSNKEAEPYLVAQVSRNTNGEDRDIMKDKEINNISTSKNRRVALPFHHLNSKVRFGVYTASLSQTDLHDYISDLVITVEKLATSASQYKAYGQDSWTNDYGYSGFQGITVEDNQAIFTFNPSPSTGDAPRSYESNDLSLHQSRSSAYWLECPSGIMQLPQNGVKLHVSMKINKEDGTGHYVFYDYEIKQEEESIDPTHWIAGYIHTYYLCLTLENEQLPILTITATLTPWEDVSGSLTTDLEQ